MSLKVKKIKKRNFLYLKFFSLKFILFFYLTELKKVDDECVGNECYHLTLNGSLKPLSLSKK